MNNKSISECDFLCWLAKMIVNTESRLHSHFYYYSVLFEAPFPSPLSVPLLVVAEVLL